MSSPFVLEGQSSFSKLSSLLLSSLCMEVKYHAKCIWISVVCCQLLQAIYPSYKSANMLLHTHTYYVYTHLQHHLSDQVQHSKSTSINKRSKAALEHGMENELADSAGPNVVFETQTGHSQLYLTLTGTTRKSGFAGNFSVASCWVLSQS